MHVVVLPTTFLYFPRVGKLSHLKRVVEYDEVEITEHDSNRKCHCAWKCGNSESVEISDQKAMSGRLANQCWSRDLVRLFQLFEIPRSNEKLNFNHSAAEHQQSDYLEIQILLLQQKSCNV